MLFSSAASYYNAEVAQLDLELLTSKAYPLNVYTKLSGLFPELPSHVTAATTPEIKAYAAPWLEACLGGSGPSDVCSEVIGLRAVLMSRRLRRLG